METKRRDVITVKNFNDADAAALKRSVNKVASIMRLELNLRGVKEPKIGLFRSLGPNDVAAKKVEIIVDVDREWGNDHWRDFVVKLDQLLKRRITSVSLDVFRMSF